MCKVYHIYIYIYIYISGFLFLLTLLERASVNNDRICVFLFSFFCGGVWRMGGDSLGDYGYGYGEVRLHRKKMVGSLNSRLLL